MVTLKGYTTDVWGSEIYRKDNRYGRYQSYGSVQIMGYPSRLASGYDENGWDWNRLPGTTTIHLPLNCLTVHYREPPWLILERIFQAVVLLKTETACLLQN